MPAWYTPGVRYVPRFGEMEIAQDAGVDEGTVGLYVAVAQDGRLTSEIAVRDEEAVICSSPRSMRR